MTGVEGIAVKIGESAVKQIGGRLRQRMRPDTSRAALIRAADDLADAVDSRERDLLAQLRGGRNMIVDDLEFRAELRLRLAAGDAIGVLKDIGPYFRRQQTRRLVVLGEPGAGKTVAVVHLLLDQLKHRKSLADAVRADEPVPVRVNAAGWDGSRDFTSWLVHQLTIDYPLNPRVARALVEANKILPVLDGLDEMDPPDAEPVLARSAVERLNKSPWQDRAVVAACRSTVYKAVRELRPDAGLQFATTVTLQPLSAEDIYLHLEQYRDELGRAEAEWAAITDQLDEADGVLATCLRTPWMLSLAATALKRGGHETAVELAACRDPAQVGERLFASLIPAAVDAIPESDSAATYTEEDVQRWLRVLARHLERRRSEHSGGAQIALDQIWHLAGPRRCRVLHVVIGGLVFAASFALAVLLFNGGIVTPALWVGLVAGIVAMLRFGLAAGPDIGKLRAKGIRRIGWRGSGVTRRFAWRVPGRTRWRRGLRRGLLVGLLGLPFYILPLFPLVSSSSATVFSTALYVSVLISASFVLGLALVAGLVSGLGTTPEERLALGQDAQRVIHDDLVSGLMAAIVWIAVWLMLGPIFGLASSVVRAYVYERRCKFLAQPGLPDEVRNSYGQLHCPYKASLAAVLKQWQEWLPAGLVIGLIVGGVFAVVLAPLSAVATGRYGVGSLLFGLTGIFPRRPARFLEWARDSGLLRVTGIAYQCRHDSYQQWLAAGGGSRDVTLRSDTPTDARTG